MIFAVKMHDKERHTACIWFQPHVLFEEAVLIGKVQTRFTLLMLLQDAAASRTVAERTLPGPICVAGAAQPLQNHKRRFLLFQLLVDLLLVSRCADLTTVRCRRAAVCHTKTQFSAGVSHNKHAAGSYGIPPHSCLPTVCTAHSIFCRERRE